MRLVSFHGPDGLHVGTVTGDEVVDVTAARPDLPRDMSELLALGDGALDAVRAADNPRLTLGDLRLTAPVPRPPKFLAIGLNYAAHVAESGMPRPDVQLWFNKQSTCVIGPGEPIHIPRASSMVDYEGELGFVIGRRCRHVPAARASTQRTFCRHRLREPGRSSARWRSSRLLEWRGSGPDRRSPPR